MTPHSGLCYNLTHSLSVHIADDRLQAGTLNSHSERSGVNVGGLQLPLPVDDDDYLVPLPQPPSGTLIKPRGNPYMDLICDSAPPCQYQQGTVKSCNGQQRSYFLTGMMTC